MTLLPLSAGLVSFAQARWRDTAMPALAALSEDKPKVGSQHADLMHRVQLAEPPREIRLRAGHSLAGP